MSKVRVHAFAISLDGFGAGPQQDIDHPFGQTRSAIANLPALGIALLVGSFAAPAAAQDWRTYATVQNPSQYAIDWRAFYEKAQALTDATRELLPHKLDVAYGTDPKQRLDLYLPKAPRDRAPVFLFIHGGGFLEGDRRQYGYIAAPLAAHGVITAVMSYRLVPRSVNDGATIAAHARHVRDGLSLMNRWAREGGNPFADAKWDEAWKTTSVDTKEWDEIRSGLGREAHTWLEALKAPREVSPIELTGMIASIPHLAYHVGAIRQINKSARGPKEGTF